jgi:hypothetical protein
MANVSFQLLATGSLAAGASTTWSWNNAPSQRVWGFSVDPVDVTGDEILPGPSSFEITRVTYKLVSPGKRVISVQVKNTGAFTWSYNLYMSRVSA